MRRLVVTGSGRCGTRYASRVLAAAGVPCGHEQVFTHRVAAGIRRPDWKQFEADSSWLAVPVLAGLGARSVLLVRHPLDVARSWLALGCLDDDQRPDVAGVIYRFRPEVRAERTPADRVLAMWTHWNLAALPYVDAVVRMEDMVRDPLTLLGPAGIRAPRVPLALTQMRADARNGKHAKKAPTDRPQWTDFRAGLALAARQVADMFGYDPDEVS